MSRLPVLALGNSLSPELRRRKPPAYFAVSAGRPILVEGKGRDGMNCKGLTEEQVTGLRHFLAIQVSEEDTTAVLPLLEASVGRIAAHNVRRHNAEALADGYSLCTRMPPGYTAGQHSVLRAQRGIAIDDLDHIIDWLKASVLASAPWLRNTDAEGRPRKLLKCRSYADLIREADKAMDRVNAQRAKALGPDDEEHVADLAEGFKLVRLLTPAALDLESSRMRHCVGHGSYDGGVEDGSIEIYSLRDPLDRPVVTIEIDVDTVNLEPDGVLSAGVRTYRDVSQVQGRRNEEPDPAHLAILKPFVFASGWKDDHYWPSIADASGTRDGVDDIPARTFAAWVRTSRSIAT